MIQSDKTSNLRTKNIGMIALALGFFLVGVAVLLALPESQSQALNGDEFSAIPIAVDYPAPDLSLIDLRGITARLSETLGQVVLVNNWATWCPPCKAEMPTLQAFYETYASDGFIIVAIESGEPAEEVQAFVDEYGITFPVWVDRQAEALHAFNNYDLPSSYVIDRTGTVRLMWTGEISRKMLDTYVAPLIH